jgi:hypothetical protein
MSDDLDALLDEALDVMEKNDEDIKQEREAMAAKLLEEQHQRDAMAVPSPFSSGGGGGDEASLIQAVTSLLEVLKQGPEAMESAPEAEVDRIQKMLQQTLGGMREGATSEELESIERCQQLLTKAGDAGNDATSPEQLEEMMRALQDVTGSPSAAAAASGNGGSPGDSDVPAALQGDLAKLMELIAKESASPQEASTSNSGCEAGSASTADAEAPSGGPTAADAEALRVFLELLKPEAITASFRAMADVFPAWLESNASTISSDDHARYTSQYTKMNEVLVIVSEGALDAVLREDATDDDKLRLERFTNALEELQALGMPPPSLVDLLQQQQAQANSN